MNDIKGIIEDVEKSSIVSDKVIKKVIEIIGKEKWNDIYDEEDDICTTTGELIITLKGIIDLEKENTELRNLKDVADLIRLNNSSVVTMAQLNNNNVALRKENAELKAQIEKMKWHKLDWDKAEENPDVDKLVRVRTRSGAEYICETYSYFPAEDEIGYGSVITQFAELNGDWVDDNEIEYWCYIEPFKEIKENECI